MYCEGGRHAPPASVLHELGWGSGVVLSAWKALLTLGKADLTELGYREGAEGLRTPRREDQGPSHTLLPIGTLAPKSGLRQALGEVGLL